MFPEHRLLNSDAQTYIRQKRAFGNEEAALIVFFDKHKLSQIKFLMKENPSKNTKLCLRLLLMQTITERPTDEQMKKHGRKYFLKETILNKSAFKTIFTKQKNASSYDE